MVTKKALITGILGQDGPYLADFLLGKGYTVYGLKRKEDNDFRNTDYLGVTSKINFIEGDLTDKKSLAKAVKAIKPNELYNLASQSFVAVSWEKAELTTKINSLGVLYLLEAIKNFSPKTKFIRHPQVKCLEIVAKTVFRLRRLLSILVVRTLYLNYTLIG